jgi:hypothetical protein
MEVDLALDGEDEHLVFVFFDNLHGEGILWGRGGAPK